jgi:tetratricopeptide (TPR) repeat protein
MNAISEHIHADEAVPHSRAERSGITVICPWYSNAAIVARQLNIWNAYPGDLKDKTKFILVDDGSPESLPAPDVDLNLTIVRITEDIPWNQPGARNLGAHLADTEYLLFTDIDHEITVDALQKAHQKTKDPLTLYRFKRVFKDRPHHPHPCSFVISKKALEMTGGFDEDFSGHRGHDDTMFRLVAEQKLKSETIDGVLVLQEAALTAGLDRDHRHNERLLESKRQALSKGTYTTGSPLRFDWKIVHQMHRKAYQGAGHLRSIKKRGMAPSCDHMPPLDKAENPIFEYAAQGQHYENRMAWEKAINWYQRALACLPNLFGSDRKIRHLALASSIDVPFTPQHASRIYAALARCLTAAGRQLDGFLARQAAAALDPENGAGHDKAPQNLADIFHGQAADLPDPERGACDLCDEITLIMATHCTRRLEKFASLSPPSNKLVTATYGSLLNVFGEGIAAGPKIICYDANPNGSERDARYTRSIQEFSEQNGFDLRSFQGVGLFNVLNQTLPHVTTPFIFFVEHDWLFRGDRILLPAIVEMMNDDPGINAIRFNKRDNYLNGQDFLMSVEAAPRPYPLLATSSYSNNPSIIRTEKLRNQWLPICENALRHVKNHLGGSAFGIEEILFRTYVQDIRAQGFRKAHEKWGTYVFGRAGDKPRIRHIGE